MWLTKLGGGLMGGERDSRGFRGVVEDVESRKCI